MNIQPRLGRKQHHTEFISIQYEAVSITNIPATKIQIKMHRIHSGTEYV